MQASTILLVEDEEAIRFGIGQFLGSQGARVHQAGSVAEALERARQFSPHLVLLDHLLPDGCALDLLPRLRQIDASMPIVILTAHGSIDLAVEAVKLGASQFLTKPIALDVLLRVIEAQLQQAREHRQQLARAARRSRSKVDPFLGRSPLTRALADCAARVASADGPVLIQGETGVGKGVLARWLHESGPRAEQAFVDLNCAGLPADFLETELFGHEKGAFTGATGSKQGLLEIAHRGTALLDEIGDMGPAVQAKLLKVLEEKTFRRLGDVRDRLVDIRLIAATHEDLESMIRRGSFRQDLFYRVSTLPLLVPPLRARREDIPLLARVLLDRVSAEMGRPSPRLTVAAEAALAAHGWPGNVRELRNVMERALLFTDGQEIGPELLALRSQAGTISSERPPRLGAWTLAELEREAIAQAMEESGGSVARAAKRLGIHRATLYQKLSRISGVADHDTLS
jgi:DNA-binding NtrC family response regulator